MCVGVCVCVCNSGSSKLICDFIYAYVMCLCLWSAHISMCLCIPKNASLNERPLHLHMFACMEPFAQCRQSELTLNSEGKLYHMSRFQQWQG